jgi:hypothetical protein
MSLLESIARGACRLAAPKAVECFDDATEMNAYAGAMQESMDPEKTWDDVQEVGGHIDRVLSPLRQAKALYRALRGGL